MGGEWLQQTKLAFSLWLVFRSCGRDAGGKVQHLQRCSCRRSSVFHTACQVTVELRELWLCSTVHNLCWGQLERVLFLLPVKRRLKKIISKTSNSDSQGWDFCVLVMTLALDNFFLLCMCGFLHFEPEKEATTMCWWGGSTERKAWAGPCVCGLTNRRTANLGHRAARGHIVHWQKVRGGRAGGARWAHR